jgi:two-component system cell cycle response regulator
MSKGGPPSSKEFHTLVVEAQPPSRGSRTKGVITVLSGVETGRVMAVGDTVVLKIGRAPDCGLRFDDASVSSAHANLACIGGQHVFSDARSTNGSYVNDVRVTEPVILKDGDRIQLGSSTFLRFSLVDPEEENALRRVYEAALRDGLTGVYNRKHLEERLDAEVSFALRHDTHLSVVMIDVDFFKRVNDTYGHLGGDAVLKTVAGILGTGLRAEDIVARYGGEEFTIVARNIDVARACALAERLRYAIAQTVVPFNGHQIRVTSSAGVASLACCPPDKRDRTTLVGIADKRLYRAKETGRDRVVGPG